MSYNPTPLLQAIQAKLVATGSFATGRVTIGEPFGAPDSNLSASVLCQDWEPSQVTLSSTVDLWTVLVRMYARRQQTPASALSAEELVANAFSTFVTALAGGFTLSGTTRAIDWVGEAAGRHVSARWGYVIIMDSPFRVVDITIPVIVDDASTFAP